jgi:hypothetical protein
MPLLYSPPMSPKQPSQEPDKEELFFATDMPRTPDASKIHEAAKEYARQSLLYSPPMSPPQEPAQETLSCTSDTPGLPDVGKANEGAKEHAPQSEPTSLPQEKIALATDTPDLGETNVSEKEDFWSSWVPNRTVTGASGDIPALKHLSPHDGRREAPEEGEILEEVSAVETASKDNRQPEDWESYFQPPLAPPPPPWQPRKYVSLNQLENADNESPEWEEVKVLRSDYDRKKYAMRKFGNRIPADPSRNLTFHAYLRKNLLDKANVPSVPYRRPSRDMNLKLEDGVLTDLDALRRE